MKRDLIALLASILFVMTVNAQQKEYRSFLFDKFEKGKVIYIKGGQVTKGYFNYETITEKMLFMLQDSTIFEFARPDIITSVKIGNRTFDHIKNGLFYEKIKAGNGILYIRRRSRLIPEGKTGPYGTKPGTGAIDNISLITSMGSTYGLKSVENFNVEVSNSYYIKHKNKFRRFDSFVDLAKQFKNHEKEIRNFVKEQNLNFRNQEDIQKAIAYCFQFDNYKTSN